MQWVIIAMLNHPSLKMSNLLYCTKNPQSPKIDFEIVNDVVSVVPVIEEQKVFHIDNAILKDVSDKLSFEYPFAAVSEIPIKYAASSMQKDDNLQYLASERPAFMGKDELTPAQRGSLMHRFMELCNMQSAGDSVKKELKRLVENEQFTKEEADAVDINKLEKFFQSDMYKRICSADKFLKEQEFAMSVPANIVVENLPEIANNEKVVVQGVIDGLIINGNRGEIIDYKTDKVSDETEIVNRYKEQMRIYKMAAEQCFSLSEVDVTLYSFALSKEISVKLEKNT
jgi:ATP-dependent helicase/nuclease subunit A